MKNIPPYHIMTGMASPVLTAAFTKVNTIKTAVTMKDAPFAAVNCFPADTLIKFPLWRNEDGRCDKRFYVVFDWFPVGYCYSCKQEPMKG